MRSAAWRDTEKGKPIDAAGELYTGEAFNTPAELRKILVENKKEAFVRCLSEKMLTYAIGRGLEYYDKPALSRNRRDDHREGIPLPRAGPRRGEVGAVPDAAGGFVGTLNRLKVSKLLPSRNKRTGVSLFCPS